MTFFQRFKRFLFGVAIGVLLTGIFFKDRANFLTSWWPENVVLREFSETEIILSDKAQCQFQYYQLDNTDVAKLLEDGDVVFSESQVKEKPYVYSIYTEDDKYNYRIEKGKEVN